MVLAQLLVGCLIRRPHLGGLAIQQLPVMVSANMNPSLIHQPVRRCRGLQGTRDVIPEVYYNVWRAFE
jgi:hypothetical protein